MKLPRARSDVVFEEIPEGAVLRSAEQAFYFGLNTVGRRVWELLPPQCDTLEELVDRLAHEYHDVSAETIRKDVLALVDELRRRGLLEVASGGE